MTPVNVFDIDKVTIDDVEMCFTAPNDLVSMWPQIKSYYEEGFGFTDPIPDKDRIAEYAYICREYKKYVNKKRAEVMRFKDDLYQMERTVASIIAKPQEYSTDRKTLVYQAMKDAWLWTLHETIIEAMASINVESEE